MLPGEIGWCVLRNLFYLERGIAHGNGEPARRISEYQWFIADSEAPVLRRENGYTPGTRSLKVC
jgi:hypothetical protein